MIFGMFHSRMTAGQKFSSSDKHAPETQAPNAPKTQAPNAPDTQEEEPTLEEQLKLVESQWKIAKNKRKQYVFSAQPAPGAQAAILKEELNLAEIERSWVKELIKILNKIKEKKAQDQKRLDKVMSEIEHLKKDIMEKRTVLAGTMAQNSLDLDDRGEDTNIPLKKIEIDLLEKKINEKEIIAQDLKDRIDDLLPKENYFMSRDDLLDWEIFHMKKNIGLNQGIEKLYCSKDFPSNLQKKMRDMIVHGNEDFFLTMFEKIHRLLPEKSIVDIDANNRVMRYWGLLCKKGQQEDYLPMSAYWLRFYPPMTPKERNDTLYFILSLEEQKERKKKFLNDKPYLKGPHFLMIFFIVRDENSAWIEDMEKYFSELGCEKGCKNGFNPEGLCEKGYRFRMISYSEGNRNQEIGEETTNLNDLSDQIKGFVKDLMEKNLCNDIELEISDAGPKKHISQDGDL